ALGIVFWGTYHPGAFTLVATHFRPDLFALAVAGLGLQFLAGGLRLRHVSAGVLTPRAGIRGQITWDFMSALAPPAVGGAPFAALFVSRENSLPYGQVTAIMLFTMLMDQLWFAIAIVGMYVSAVWLPVFPTSLGAAGVGTVALYLGGLLVYISFFAYATLVRPELIETVAGYVVRLKWLRRFEPTVRRETRRLGQQARRLRHKPLRFYLIGVAYTALYWVARYGILLMVALSFVADVPQDLAHFPEYGTFRATLYVIRSAGLWLAGLVMPTPGGAGGIEALAVLYLGPLLPEGFIGPVLIVWRLLTYHFVLGIGLIVAGHVLKQMLRGDAPPPILDPDDETALEGPVAVVSGERP
ncbi:MAG TPA: lysylphosphatidylglycerol synthase transmembrane domain-containing protein, partial [Rubricoccaceae bacterium]